MNTPSPAPPTSQAPRSDSEPLPTEQARRVGFHALAPEQEDLVRRCREEGERLRALLFSIGTLRPLDSESQRWRAIAQTDLQKGLMSAVRAIAGPEFF